MNNISPYDMKAKTTVALIVAIALIIATFNMPVYSSQMLDEPNNELYLEDVNILIIGRCRTTLSYGTWIGRLFIGKQPYVAVGVHDTPLERLHIIIYNESISDSWMSFLGLINSDVSMLNATGIFFWGAKESGVSRVPPIIFVWCHAEQLWIQ